MISRVGITAQFRIAGKALKQRRIGMPEKRAMIAGERHRPGIQAPRDFAVEDFVRNARPNSRQGMRTINARSRIDTGLSDEGPRTRIERCKPRPAQRLRAATPFWKKCADFVAPQFEARRARPSSGQVEA